MLNTAKVSELVGSAVHTISPVSGGDVAQSYRCELDDGRVVFAKTHANPPRRPGELILREARERLGLRNAPTDYEPSSGVPAQFFSTEAWGIEWMHATATVHVATVLGVSDDPPLLVLDWIEESAGHPTDDPEFGRALAGLHQAGAPSFGREDRRTTGSRGLPNEPCASWVEFFASQRLLPLCRLASETGALEPTLVTEVERIAARLHVLGGPAEPAARLHGDLWAGNRIVDEQGRSWLIDPACHGGHREFDLAMMQLFGGFSADIFGAYHEEFPLADGWRERVQLHQLAPLMVHAIKFGASYVPAVRSAVSLLR